MAALASHSTKATTRATVNVSPEPVSNITLSLFEDGLAAGVVALALAFPALALVLVIVLVIAGAWVVVMLWRAIARVWRRISLRNRASP